MPRAAQIYLEPLRLADWVVEVVEAFGWVHEKMRSESLGTDELKAYNLLGRDCGHPVDNYSLCPIMKDDGAFAPLQGKDYAGSMHRHGYAKPGNETPSLCITYWREHI